MHSQRVMDSLVKQAKSYGHSLVKWTWFSKAHKELWTQFSKTHNELWTQFSKAIKELWAQFSKVDTLSKAHKEL